MRTIYRIKGNGGQHVQRCAERNQSVFYEVIENSNLVEVNGCEGRDSFTNEMWSVDLDDLQRWANQWAGKKVRLIEYKATDEH